MANTSLLTLSADDCKHATEVLRVVSSTLVGNSERLESIGRVIKALDEQESFERLLNSV